MAIPTAAAITSAGLATGQTIVAIAFYAVVPGSGIASPRGHAHLPRPGPRHPRRVGVLLGQNNAAAMTVLFLIFATALIGRGIAGI